MATVGATVSSKTATTLSSDSKCADLDRLIATLRDPDSELMDRVKYPDKLLAALAELRSMVGMDKIKNSIAVQTLFLLKSPDDGKRPMLNTVIYSPPGSGKTTVGKILAKIWFALGILEPKGDSKRSQMRSKILSQDNSKMLMWVLLGGYLVCMWGFIAMKKLYTSTNLYVFIGVIIVLLIAALLAFKWFFAKGVPASSFRGQLRTLISQDSGPDGVVFDDESPDKADIIKIVSRDDFVAGYLGQTAIKTKALLTECLGKVVFIDEAYSLCNDPRDSFGMEALTTLNMFMSEHADEIVVIFAGYRDLLQSGIFKMQPGLPRRCMWHFDCDRYTPEQLYDIFHLQVRKAGWSLHIADRKDIKDLIVDNGDVFKSFGGDTERLVFFCQLESVKDDTTSSGNTTLNKEHVRKAIAVLADNNIADADADKSSKDAKKKARQDNLLQLLQQYGQGSESIEDGHGPAVLPPTRSAPDIPVEA